MHIVHVVESINRGGGGEALAATQIAGAVTEAEYASCDILAFDLKHLGAPIATPKGVRTRLFEPQRPHLLGRSLQLRRAISEAAATGATAFHLHSLWRFPLLWSSRACSEQGIPCVVSPHGALQPEARSQKWIRKRLFWRPVRQALQRAAVLCATSEREAASLRALLPDVRVVVIPLGVDSREFEHLGRSTNGRSVLFLSRLHRIKGLSSLLEAWSMIRPAGWTLTIAGPDESGLLAGARSFVAENGLSDSVEFVGPAYGEAKHHLLARADIFVLPTLGENFGLVVAEALAAGVPVITTRSAPWEDLITHRCGWWIDTGAEPLTEALREALSLDADERRAMGQRGRRLIRQDYDHRKVADKLAALYRSLAVDNRI